MLARHCSHRATGKARSMVQRALDAQESNHPVRDKELTPVVWPTEQLRAGCTDKNRSSVSHFLETPGFPGDSALVCSR